MRLRIYILTEFTGFVFLVGGAFAASDAKADSPTRKNYFPKTEVLQADEMRVVALGTGTPNFQRSQASASYTCRQVISCLNDYYIQTRFHLFPAWPHKKGDQIYPGDAEKLL